MTREPAAGKLGGGGLPDDAWLASRNDAARVIGSRREPCRNVRGHEPAAVALFEDIRG